jgi:hypothetical protein
MAININWSDSSIEDVAEILLVINPLGYNTVDDLVAYIKSATNVTLDKAGFWGTGGFYVSLCDVSYESEYTHAAKVTLMAYTVKKYLETIGKM